ncbi:glutathione S-transferase [Tateyamaria pelophila]|uniref:glutathione S-transferase n=1 Tax=Tateyamaria pelophila TaxID=328415 RepID=UPI001CBDA5AE|nr:glutathione S-transferase [Tateyamaria pelophila]
MHPILYSFRRCPYAMRARLALAAADEHVEVREILLRDKHPAFLAASGSGTVPCLVTAEETIDESLDIMTWALAKNDPEGWLAMPDDGWDLIKRADGPFKDALDRTKYATRYPQSNSEENREIASAILTDWNAQLGDWMFGRPTIADFAVLPFVRQFAFIDKGWFDAQPWPNVQKWLERFVTSDRFQSIMFKLPPWQEGDQPILQTETGLVRMTGSDTQ